MTPRPARERLGVTHAAGCYHPGTGSFLVAGAQEVERLGSSVIKLWFDGHPELAYRFDPLWPRIASLTQQAQEPRFEQVFTMPFTSYVLEAFRAAPVADYWLRDGFTEEDAAAEAEEFRELTVHFRERYRGTGKTFVVQNWEGDWAVRGHTDRTRFADPDALERFERWIMARQRGVEQGRAETPDSDVAVWNAVEVNLVKSAMDGNVELTTHVLPRLRCDLYSYSCWDPPGADGELTRRLEFIRDHCEPSEGFGRDNVFLGEYGFPELQPSWMEQIGDEAAAAITADMAREALAFGCPYVLFWEVYDNECERQPEGCLGAWLIKPDGSESATRRALAAVLDDDNKREPEP